MELRLKIKPSINKGRTKEQALQYIKGYMIYHSSGSHMIDYERKTALLYNIHKRNKKTKHIKYKSGPNKGKVKKTEIIHPTEWTAYIYRIPLDLIGLMNIKITQNTRNFVIESK